MCELLTFSSNRRKTIPETALNCVCPGQDTVTLSLNPEKLRLQHHVGTSSLLKVRVYIYLCVCVCLDVVKYVPFILAL